jgi:MFS family permease
MPSRYRWVIVAVGALLSCVAIGTMFSLAVFLEPMSRDTGWSRTGISSALTINFLAMGVAGFGWGTISDRFGPRAALLPGSLLLGVGVVLSSQARSVLAFELIYGVLVGVGAGAIMPPMMATVTGWFDKQRALAVSLVSCGIGVAPMTISPLARWLTTTYDWRTAQWIIGILAWCLMIPAAMLARRAPAASRAGHATRADSEIKIADALRTPQFLTIALAYFCCCAMHSGPIFHTVSYAIACGIPAMAAVSIYGVEGFAGLVGRLLFGVAGDRYGAKNALVTGLLIQAAAALSYFFTRELGEFYVVAAIFGMAYGGVMPLYAVLLRENFPIQIMGRVMGAAAMISNLGMALGPLAGGWIFDRIGSYGWLYIGSFGIGLGAVAIAAAYRPAVPAARAA